MKNGLIILIFVLLGNISTNAQYYRPRKNNVQFVGSLGIGLGQENLLSLPKLSGLISFEMNRKNNRNRFWNFQKNAFFAGTEVSIVILFGMAVSIAGTVGLKTGPITIDCSITRLILTNPDGVVVSRQTTVNPKLGIILGPVWIKTGPSLLSTNPNIFGNTFGNFMHIKAVPFNLEVNYSLTW